jgi:hypothetical protein
MTGCYHQAAGALGGNGWNELAVTEAQNFLRRALELDGDFALARGQLALLSARAQNTGLVEHSAERTLVKPNRCGDLRRSTLS